MGTYYHRCFAFFSILFNNFVYNFKYRLIIVSRQKLKNSPFGGASDIKISLHMNPNYFYKSHDKSHFIFFLLTFTSSPFVYSIYPSMCISFQCNISLSFARCLFFLEFITKLVLHGVCLFQFLCLNCMPKFSIVSILCHA